MFSDINSSFFSFYGDNGKQGKLTEHHLFVQRAQFKIYGRTASGT